MEGKIRGFFFDFDNTIADDYKFIVDCFVYTFKKMGIDFKTSEIDNFMGLKQRDILSKFINTDNGVQDAMEIFNFYFESNYLKGVTIFKGIEDLIKSISVDFKLSIVSGGQGDRIKKILKKYKLYDNFEYIISSQDVSFPKPNPEGLNLALNYSNLNFNEIIYIGDSVSDYELCENTKTKFILATWGNDITFSSILDKVDISFNNTELLNDYIYKYFFKNSPV